MSGSNVILTCPKCSTQATPRGKALTRAMTCPNCGAYFSLIDKTWIEFQHSEPQSIPIGATGRIDDYPYEVVGFVVKQETKHHYRWREYFLYNPYRGYAFLSEYDGHWNFIWPVEHDPRANKSDEDFYEGDSYFRLYQRYSATVVQANGEFFFDVYEISNTTINYEYIAPPYLYSLEQSDDSVLWCRGEYMTKADIAATFKVEPKSLPTQWGIGYTQPFRTPFKDASLIVATAAMMLIAFVLHIAMSTSAKDEEVYKGTFYKDQLTEQKVIVTPSFELKDTKNLEVYLSAPINNDWFFSEFALINDTDGTEYNFVKEIEYYEGVSEGSRWTEGAKNGDALLSQIPSGKYHLNIYPEYSFANQEFTVIVSRDVPVSSNFFLTLLALIIYPVFYFIRKRHRERRRWSDSEYSPYEE
jgi:hypothetical protein